ncbi:MAG: polyprenyl synthetase family protein, partial [Euryarchaeota archaeon]|nr:polyprenyl synthetase family protein [Euryarchaeota archaeon]
MRDVDLEAALAPYRDRSNREIAAIVEAYERSRAPATHPSLRTLSRSQGLFRAGKRYRYAIACLGYQALTGRPDFDVPARPATWLELYHLYTLFLDDIMDEDERRRAVRSAWSVNAQGYRGR